MVEWRNGGKGLTNWSGSCMIFVCLYEVNNTKNPSKKGMETDMSERKQAPETPWYLRPFGPLVSLALLCVVWGVYGKARLSGRRTRAQRAWQVVSQGCVYDLGRDLTRHNCFRYCNRGSLSSAYFAQATAALSDGYIYLALTHSNSPAGEVIGLFTGRAYNHISLAFDRKEFDHFDRGDYTGVHFAGMLEYDGDLKIPEHYLVEPPVIKNTLTEVLCAHGIREYALSETQKYGHVTYFWNGNRSGKVDEHLETYEEIPSDVIPFEQAPAMKSVEITDHMVRAMASHQFDFLRCNFPNGDMVGHTGVLEAVVTAMECVDRGLARILKAADAYGYTVLVTADHGNADQMLETKKGKTSIRTAHSLNPVPFIIYDRDTRYELKEGSYGLANVAPTVVKLMDIPAPACWEASMV